MAYENKPDINELMHYGMPRRSGRYPWGSGKDPHQHCTDFLSRIQYMSKEGVSDEDIAKTMGLTMEQFQIEKSFAVINDMTKQGKTEKEIADALGTSTTKVRLQKTMIKDGHRAVEVEIAKDLREQGYSLNEIAKQMGYKNDSSVRSLLNAEAESRMKEAEKTAEFLRKQVDEKGMIDIGTGVERELGISREKLNQAVMMLEMEGYHQYGGGVAQVNNPGKQTNLKVLAAPDKEHKDIYDYKNIHSITEYHSKDEGQTFETFHYPASMDSKRLAIRYAEDGGIDKDGLVEIRRGVADLDLGGSHYAQVRIMVDGTHYIKGMAVYSDDLPKGVDVMFNTNKTKDKSKMEVLKKIKDDPDNPFGSLIKAGGQSFYTDANGEKKLSLINKRAEEGDWGEWADKLPSQFLSKQNLKLVKQQLGLAEADKQAEFDEIMSLTNPTVKKALLKSFADDCDSSAVHLQAAALPGQKYQVILPVPSMKDTEIYAPNYENGSKVALVRYPHGGLFEIPILTVNNKQKDAEKMIGKNPLDAVCINSKVAERLSGADFDGDTVMVIPTGKGVNVSSKPALKELEGFDPKMQYPEVPGMKYMKNTQTEMGKISNLITDMTLLGANDQELARAVKHSMVVIDAEKHKLNYKQSEKDNNIAELKRRYQGHIDENGRYKEGAGTLISRAKSKQVVLKRQGSPKIDPETGKQTWDLADELTYEKKIVNEKTGEVTYKTETKRQNSTKMAETDDAYTLLSKMRNPKEIAYADYANKMKALANEARKAMVNTKDIQYSPDAKVKYAPEVDRLNAALNVALKNAPKERQAQAIANATVQAKKAANPDMTKKELKKAGQQALDKARRQIGAKKEMIEISEREWEAIQSGAISTNKLQQILNNCNMDTVKQMAMPRTTNSLSQAKINHIGTLKASGYTNEQIAKKLGVSVSTIIKYMKGDK
ncbi:MAG: helix-turn-helix domain-containing protein [Prevotella sp.]|nr:helix-turn-helix domain-containing protein [Prevotella sp.]